MEVCIMKEFVTNLLPVFFDLVEGCIDLWEEAPVQGRCYQVVSTAVVTWHEARDACRSQGGDLLSVSSPQELEFCKISSFSLLILLCYDLYS